MRVFIAVLVLIFSLQSLTKADDIRDFEIEGMGIGDSLLVFYDEKEIKKNKTEGPRGKGKFYKTTIIDSKFNEYDFIEFYLKTNDKKYKIYAINALIDYDDQIDKCKIKKKKVLNDLEKFLKEKFHTFKGGHDLDKKSIVYQSYFKYESGANVRVECYDWTNKSKKKYNVIDNLGVSLVSKQVQKWISDGYN